MSRCACSCQVPGEIHERRAADGNRRPLPLLVLVPVCVVDGPAKPESVSVAVKVATTSVLFQPAAFAKGLWLV